MVFFDEAHKALAPTYQELLDDLRGCTPSPALIGLSATPGRSAGLSQENKRLASVFDCQLISPDFGRENAILALQNRGILARLQRRPIRAPGRVTLSPKEKRHLSQFLELPPSVLQRLGTDLQRNLMIVASTIEQVTERGSAIVFACSVEHSKILAAMITLKGVPAAAVTSDISSTARSDAIDGFRDGRYAVLSNYGILSTGFDAPGIGAVVIARPTKSIVLYSQMIGRGLRGPRVGGSDECVLVDVVDNIEGFGTEDEIYDYFAGYWS